MVLEGTSKLAGMEDECSPQKTNQITNTATGAGGYNITWIIYEEE